MSCGSFPHNYVKFLVDECLHCLSADISLRGQLACVMQAGRGKKQRSPHAIVGKIGPWGISPTTAKIATVL
jgi:hypothetical protein